MISLIVCSIHPDNTAALKANVQENIGVDHEWLVWDNRKENFGLCKVYNMMAEKAKYPYLCFIHEDVLINTNDWGQVMIDITRNISVDLIGVAGGKYKSHMFSGWYSGGKDLDYYSLFHRTNGKDEPFESNYHWLSTEVSVATIDGVFMFCTKALWETIRFNETLLKGFHYYDIDFSLRAAQNNKVVVTNQLKLIHFSMGGDFGDKWVNETISFHQANRSLLPFSVAENVGANIDLIAAEYWLDWLKNMPISMSNRVKWIRLQQLQQYSKLWYSIVKFLLYKPLNLQRLHHAIKRRNQH